MKSNPYTVGSFVSSGHFYDRRAILDELMASHRQCICLIGGRRTGKTSVLRRIEEELTQASPKFTGQIPVYLNLQSIGDDPTQVGNRLIEAVRQNHIPWLAQTGSLSRETCDVVRKLAERARAKGFQLLLLWDEAEKLLQLPHNQLECLRSILQDSSNLRLVMTGTRKLYALNSRNQDSTSPFLVGFDIQYLPMLADTDADALIRRANNPPESRVNVGDSLVKKICGIAGNHPYFIQHLCQLLFDSEQGTLRDLEEDDLALTFVLESVCESDYDSLDEEEHQVLHQLSRDESGTTYSALSQAVKLSSVSLTRCLNELIFIGLIQKIDQRYRIANHFLNLWIKEHLAQTAMLLNNQAMARFPDEQTDHERITHSPSQTNTPPAAIHTDGGTYISGNVYISGDLVGHDQKDQSIQVGDISGSTGIAVGHGAQVHMMQSSGATLDEIAIAFTSIYQVVNAMPEGVRKREVHDTVQKLETEARLGEQAQESRIQHWLTFLAGISEDVWDVAITTLSNPIAGVSTVFKRVARRAKE